MGDLTDRLLELRPVAFRYKAEVQKGERPLEYGLIAEAVAEVFPDLVVHDEDGKPFTVNHLLSSMLLNELEKMNARLTRELEEELGIETRPTCFFPVAFASHTYEDFHLLMPLFACRAWKNVPRAKEHTALKWVRANDLLDYPMPPADIPLVSTLREVI